MEPIDTSKARQLLKDSFPLTERATQYIAVYKTPKGRELALERERADAYYLWLEHYDQTIPGVRIKNREYPGQPYERKQGRNSNLNDTNAPRLKPGNKVWYLEIENLDALRLVVDWYKSV